MKIAIINYDIGNVQSILNAFEKQNVNAFLTREKNEILDADGVILPGVGAFSYGFQREHIDLGQTTTAIADALFYRVDSIGLAYAVNDALSISYNIMEQKQHNVGANNENNNQETDAINIGYTVGGLTIGFQDASTDNANMVKDAKDDTRTVSVKAAF